MKIKFTKGFKGPLKVSNGTYHSDFAGHAPFEVEEQEWLLLQKVRVSVPTGKKDDEGRPVSVAAAAFEIFEGPADTAPVAAARPAPGRPVAVDEPAAESKGGK